MQKYYIYLKINKDKNNPTEHLKKIKINSKQSNINLNNHHNKSVKPTIQLNKTKKIIITIIKS
jgi:hypothetical protein